MRIPASRFTDLPEGCPVLWGDTPATLIGRHSATEYRLRTSGRMALATAGAESQLVVALDSPAATRAFAPELIAAVKGRTRFTTPQRQPSAVWHAGFRRWILVDYLTDIDSVVSYEPTTALITGSTPAECLLNGLQAALDAAKDAQCPPPYAPASPSCWHRSPAPPPPNCGAS